MKSLFVNLISENWLHAIGASLFHSLWIGVVLSVLTAVLLSVTRKSSSALRYQLLVGCLLLFMAGVGTAFVYELNNVSSADSQTAVTQVVAQPVAVPAGVQSTVDTGRFNLQLDGLMNLWNTYSSQIVLIWFLIICAKSIHLWVGLSGIAFLKKSQVYEAGKFWESRICELSNKLGINQSIKLVQSGIAKVPMVVGHFKPVILIPLGLINGLGIAEVEAILAHELAHVKRRDYLINLLQNLLEIMFFFNPAVLWMSKLIRTEREHCCDDLALQCVGDKKNYVNALLYCQEFQSNAPAYAMAITGGKHQLLDRVKRMLFNKRTTLNRIEKAFLTIALVSVFIFSAAFIKVHSAIATGSLNNLNFFQDVPKKQDKPNPKQKTKSKTKPAQKTTTKIRSKVTVDGGVVQDNYREITPEDKYRMVQDSLNYKKHQEQYKRDQQAYTANKQEYFKSDRDYQRNQIEYKRREKEFEKNEKRYERNRVVADSMRKIHELKYRADSIRAKLSSIAKPLTPVKPEAIAPLKGKTSAPATINPPAALSTPTSSTSSTSSSSSSSVRTKESISVTDGDGMSGKRFSDMVTNEMIKDGIIKSTTNLAYKLDGKNFIVNGDKLDAETHEKYKAKYLKKPGTALLYNYAISNN